jgi:tetratricopeptide (TPR) repeat protein/tRNA A-37 threonylcarbamoyl transferase component Bud32
LAPTRDTRSTAKSPTPSPSSSDTEPTITEVEGVPIARERFSDVEGERLFEQVRARMFATGGKLRVGRYTIRRLLGAGAMGEVHLAVDEELDRPIAIKFVHAHLGRRRWAERLRVEARALARLAHPNVVRVYEVGEHEGRVYLAMEYIEGGSLGDWIRGKRPSWEQILAAYVDAGRGLAAAHGAGVVHRDFKPDNVLRGSDGRVAVADFGLAALEHGPTLADDEDEDEATRRPILAASRTGEVKGTPAYMPPEQFEGRSDARSDQFALCVSMFEGLWGRRPFPNRSLTELLRGEADWTPVPPPSDSKVPGWIWPILRRGLSPDPGDRFADVGELLAAIEQAELGRRRRARRVQSGLAAVVVGLASGGAVAWFNEAELPIVDDCVALEAELADTWDGPRRERMAERFSMAATESGEAWLADSEAPVAASLDRWRERWLESRRALCRARAGGDPVVLDRIGECLERHRRSTQAVVDLLLAGEVDTLREAPQAVQSLADPASCEREARQGGPPAAPEAVVAEVEQIRAEFALVEADLLTGRNDAALSKIEALTPQVAEIDHVPLSAELTHLRGRALLDSRPEEGFEALELAADLAEGARHDRVVADSWRWMAMVAATDFPDLDRGRRWLRRADASATRIGMEAIDEARLDYVRGNLYRIAKQPDAAIEQLEPALATFEAHDDRLYASHAASDLGIAVLLEGGEPDRALELFERALTHSEQVHGPRHPAVAMAAYNLGQAALEAGLPELARTLLERAVAIWAEADGLEARDAGRAHLALAQIALPESRLDAALEHARASAAAFDQSLAASDIEHAEAAAILATSHYFLGQFEPAVVEYRRAVAGYTEAYGPDDVYTANFRVGLGWALLAAGHVDEARAEFESGLATIESVSGSGSAESIDARFGLVAVDLATKRLEPASTRLAEFDEETLAGIEGLELELFRGLLALRRDPADPEGAAALQRAHTQAALIPSGAVTLAILLESVNPNPKTRP